MPLHIGVTEAGPLIAGVVKNAAALVPLKAVIIKMLPFDDKNELALVVDMPRGSTLEATLFSAGGTVPPSQVVLPFDPGRRAAGRRERDVASATRAAGL